MYTKISRVNKPTYLEMAKLQSLDLTVPQCTALHYTTSHWTEVTGPDYTAVHCAVLHHIALHCNTVHCSEVPSALWLRGVSSRSDLMAASVIFFNLTLSIVHKQLESTINTQLWPPTHNQTDAGFWSIFAFRLPYNEWKLNDINIKLHAGLHNEENKWNNYLAPEIIPK